ncbi:Alpha-galactosidase [Besnoitia besnoiti]|uniref:Alpha-galactosidase n=1 Tax=Besnoitia besnoiti TaxID=94643 RepID=A0A2A9MB24_BESBE|nr:Alpha-galactosidase [Besnoitia besnoiti]PFH32592.1 Alpha-galactosidase [Besnoitia besnoiti]
MEPLLRETVKLEKKLLDDVFGDEEEAHESAPHKTRRRMMGWTSASWPDCKKQDLPDESQLRSVADRLSERDFRQAGYDLVLLDGCWASAERDSEGRLQADASRFPSGMRALVDYVHEKGLRFGIGASLAGACSSSAPISPDSEPEQDVSTFLEWGVDVIQLHACHSIGVATHREAASWRVILQSHAEASPIPQLLCSWLDSNAPASLATGDREELQKELHTLSNICTVQHIVEKAPRFWTGFNEFASAWKRSTEASEVVGPSPFLKLSPQHLPITGAQAPTPAEVRVELSLFALSGAPILLAGDIASVSPALTKILTGSSLDHVIDNMDMTWLTKRLGDSVEVRVSSLEGPDFGLALVNWGDKEVSQQLDWQTLAGWLGFVREFPLELRNVWKDEGSTVLTVHGPPVEIVIAPHDAAVFTVMDMPHHTEPSPAAVEPAPRVEMGAGVPFFSPLGVPRVLGSAPLSFRSAAMRPLLFPPAFTARPLLRGAGVVRIFRIAPLAPPAPPPPFPMDHLMENLNGIANKLLSSVIPELERESKAAVDDEERPHKHRVEKQESHDAHLTDNAEKAAEQAREAVKNVKKPLEVGSPSSQQQPHNPHSSEDAREAVAAKEASTEAEPKVEAKSGTKEAKTSREAKELSKESGHGFSEANVTAQPSKVASASWPVWLGGLVVAGLLIALLIGGRELLIANSRQKGGSPPRMQLMQCERPHAN